MGRSARLWSAASEPSPRAGESPQPSTPARTLRVQEEFDVLQGVGGSTLNMRADTPFTQGGDDQPFVKSTVDPGQVSEAGGGERLHLVVIVIQQGQVEILRLFPIAVAV